MPHSTSYYWVLQWGILSLFTGVSINMNKWLELFLQYIPSIKSLLAGSLAGPILAFFSVPSFYLLMLILVVDMITGIYKARVLGILTSSKFSTSFERAFGYVMIFIVLHALTIISPALIIIEHVILAGFAIREAISVVENVRTVELFRGRSSPVMDKLVKLLGLNLDKLLKEAEQGLTNKEDNKHETKESQ